MESREAQFILGVHFDLFTLQKQFHDSQMTLLGSYQ
jgi:hypothetical protein